ILGPSNQDQHQFNKLGLKHENQAPFAMIPGEDGCDTIHPSNGKMSANEFPIDPNEPTYCFCKQVAFGEMIACDNDDCDIKWFHFECVNMKTLPKGVWYCFECESLENQSKPGSLGSSLPNRRVKNVPIRK
ncbi:hypothetical protein DI09_215p20, partial [Mitosporidium daphniae]